MLTLRVSDPDPIVLGLGEEQEAVLTAEPAVYVSIADYYDGPYTVTPGTEAITLETDGFTMSEDVTVQAVPVGSEGVPVATKGAVSNHQIAVTPSVTNAAGLIEGGTRTGASVTVSASELVSGTKNISANGSGIDVVNYEAVNVAVPPPALQNKSRTYTPTESDFTETLTADTGFDGIGEVEVTVSAIPSTYVGSAIPRRASSNLTASGATVTAPAGYYSTAASKSVASGTAGTPTASKVIVPEDVAAVITPSVTNGTGYITGGTKTGSSVVVNARELVSGNTLTCDSPGNWDVAEIETFTVPSGSAGTPTASKGTVSNHAVTVTPSVTNTAGYISSGTRTGAGVSVTASELVSGTKSITANGTGIDVSTYAAVDVAVPIPAPSLQTKSASYTPTTSQQTDSITADVGFDGIDTVNVTVDAVPVGSIIQGYINGDFDDENNTRVWYPRFDFEAYGLFSGFDSFSNMGYYLAVPANTTVTPTESAQTVGGNGYMMEDAVTVSAIPSNYVGSGITRRDSSDLTASGATVTVPVGYYSASASKAVASGTEGTPTATKGTVSNHSVSVTPSVTNGAGYISGGTHTGTAVSVTAAELVSGTYNVTSSGTKDVTNYASASVPAGSATPAASISGISATVSTGTNTITLSKTVSNTPQVSAGYVSSGTAGNSSVSLTANVTTKGTATITPGTTNQTISSGTYITGTQTISGDANLVAGNIKSGTTIFGVTGTYSGGGGGDSKNAQVVQQGNTRIASTTYSKACGDITVSKTGTYDVYWSAYRTSTSGTWGTQLYISGVAYGSAQATFSSYYQTVHLSNVSLTANQTVSVYGRSRGSNYYLYVGQLTIIEA